MSGSRASGPHPDRLFPADPATRAVARSLHSYVADAAIFSPHSHVDARLLAADEPFRDPSSLLITPDHYVTRILHASGIHLAELGVGRPGSQAAPREIWRRFCGHWDVLLGTPSRYWLESELSELFGITEPLGPATADETYDAICAALAEPAFRPRALFRRFGIETLATTDDPLDDLAAHAELAADASLGGQVIPTFRPDAFWHPERAGWTERLQALEALTGTGTTEFTGFLDALRVRRRYFIARGAVASDHGVLDAQCEPLAAADAARLHARALRGELDLREARAYRRNGLFEMARMSTEDGLVMQLHPGVLRGHHRATANAYGPDTGHDIPLPVSFTRPLRPILDAFGTHPAFRLVLYTVDESTYSREIAPLAGFYPSVFVGAPWWFLDAPDAITRFHAAVVETAGFAKLAGFVDDTRAFCSIPARHDMARRLQAAHLARLVVEHRLSEDDAHHLVRHLVVDAPRRAYRLAEV